MIRYTGAIAIVIVISFILAILGTTLPTYSLHVSDSSPSNKLGFSYQLTVTLWRSCKKSLVHGVTSKNCTAIDFDGEFGAAAIGFNQTKIESGKFAASIQSCGKEYRTRFEAGRALAVVALVLVGGAALISVFRVAYLSFGNSDAYRGGDDCGSGFATANATGDLVVDAAALAGGASGGGGGSVGGAAHATNTSGAGGADARRVSGGSGGGAGDTLMPPALSSVSIASPHHILNKLLTFLLIGACLFTLVAFPVIISIYSVNNCKGTAGAAGGAVSLKEVKRSGIGGAGVWMSLGFVGVVMALVIDVVGKKSAAGCCGGGGGTSDEYKNVR